MRNRLLVMAVYATLGVVVTCAQDESAYQGWMKTAGATSGSLRKNLEAKNAQGAAADAKKLQEVFGSVADFWTKKSVDDAAKFAGDAQAGFGETAELAAAGKFDDAAAALKKASANCGGCHTAHREKAADGSWKIK